ncbi:MAG: thymidylate synthase [Candidatus Diapherotrites archaeon]
MGSEHFIEGNSSSSTVICTFWTLANSVAEKLDSNMFAVCANQYSFDALNTITRAILKNPHWRNLVLYGADLTHTGDAWAAFFQKGIDEDGKIKGTNFTFQLEIAREALEQLRKNVTLIDLRGKRIEELVHTITQVPMQKPFAPPCVFPEAQPVAFQVFPSEKQGFVIRAPTISHGWLQLLDIIMKFGEEKPTEYGNKQKEIINLLCIIEDDDENIPEFLPFSSRDFEEYKGKILTAEKPENVAYTYGSRLHAWPGTKPINQVRHIIEYLKKTPYTRRAVAVTWNVEKDISDKNPPCLTEIVWSVSHGKLQQTCMVRSHDMFEGWPLNLFGWRELQRTVSQETGIPIGSIMVLSTSAHIYDKKWEDAKKILMKYPVSSAHQFDPDPRGNFVIRLNPEKKQMSIQHFTPLGEKTHLVWENTQVDEKLALEELFSKLAQSNMISRTDHAFYLGAELQKAFLAMKLGKEYKQDKALE